MSNIETRREILEHSFWLLSQTEIYQYLFCNTAGRLDGPGKAHNHKMLCQNIIAITQLIEVDDAYDYQFTHEGRPHKIGSGKSMYEFVHRHTQCLTDNLNVIGLEPDNYRPDYEPMAILFRANFFDLAIEAIDFWKEAEVKEITHD